MGARALPLPAAQRVGLTGSRAIAEDGVQDCFANAWKHREQLRDATLARA